MVLLVFEDFEGFLVIFAFCIVDLAENLLRVGHLYTYSRIHICTYTHAFIHIFTYSHVHINTFIYTHVHIHIHLYTCTHIYARGGKREGR